MHQDDRLDHVGLAFLNAPFEPDGWAVAMRQLARATRTSIAQLIGAGRPMALPLNLLTEQPDDPHGHINNPLLYGPENWRINATRQAMTLEYEPHYRTYREQHPGSIYDDAVSDLDLPYGCQSALMFDADCLVGISLLRSSREGPCNAEILHAFSRSVRQAQRAMRVQLALGQDLAETMLSGLIGRPEATLLLDRYGHLCSMTEAAEKLFDHPHGLRLETLLVRLADRAEDASFAAAVGRLLASDGLTGAVLHEGRAGRCDRHPGGRWRLIIARLPASARGFGFEPQLAVTLKPLLTKAALTPR